jgi:hypothetical protein
MSTHNLDDLGWLTALDPGGMGRCIAELPWQCREAIDLARSIDLP